MSLRELLTVTATVIVALPIARLILSRRAAGLVARVRAVQTGSVNGYAGYLVVGLLGTIVSLSIAAR